MGTRIPARYTGESLRKSQTVNVLTVVVTAAYYASKQVWRELYGAHTPRVMSFGNGVSGKEWSVFLAKGVTLVTTADTFLIRKHSQTTEKLGVSAPTLSLQEAGEWDRPTVVLGSGGPCTS